MMIKEKGQPEILPVERMLHSGWHKKINLFCIWYNQTRRVYSAD
jgi:hypothetical protein